MRVGFYGIKSNRPYFGLFGPKMSISATSTRTKIPVVGQNKPATVCRRVMTGYARGIL